MYKYVGLTSFLILSVSTASCLVKTNFQKDFYQPVISNFEIILINYKNEKLIL